MSTARHVRSSFALVAATSVAAVVALTGAPAGAQTATTTAPRSQSSARVLSGTLGSTSLDTIAAANATTVQNFGGAAVTKSESPDVTALNNAITVPLGSALNSLTAAIPGVTLGVLNQAGTARKDGSAEGSAGVGSLGLDLGRLLGSAAASIAALKINIGALTATAQQALGITGAQTGSCTIADVGLELSSPLIAQLISGLTTALAPLDTLTTTLTGLINSQAVIQVTGVPTVAGLIAQLTTVTTPDGSIAIDLANGTISVDLAKLLAAAGLDLCSTPNTHLLPALVDALKNKLPALLQTAINDVVQSVLNTVKLCTTPSETGCIRITVAGQDVSTLGATVVNTLTSTLTSTVSTLTGSVSSLLGSIATTVLGPIADTLDGILDLISDVRATSGGAFSETALQLTIGGGTGSSDFAPTNPPVQLNLANATVGPDAAVASVSATRTPTPTPTVIKIDAGEPPLRNGSGANLLVGLGVVGSVLLIGTAGGVGLLRRRARHL